MTSKLVWVDCEMTGLDESSDALIEVAALVTDADLNVLGEGVDLLITPPESALENMGDFVREMHTASGLLDELAERGISMESAQEQVLDYISPLVPAGKAPLGGNTVGTDRLFLARDMPLLTDYLHYRNVDVSTIKELARRWFPKAHYNSPAKCGGHRALADIQESIEELRYYRETIFTATPPTSSQAREIAARHRGALTGFEAPEKQQD